MDSDPQLYRIFRSCPLYLGYFTQLKKHAGYRFSSPTLKNSERRLDGVLFPSDDDAPIILFEFQMIRKDNIYLRTCGELCQLQQDHPKKEVRAVIIFFDKKTDPGPPSWLKTSKRGAFQVKYMKDVVVELPEHHPLRLVLTPFLNPNRQQLKEHAADLIREINQADLSPEQRATLNDVFCSFILQIFRDLTNEEIFAMLDMTFSLRDTRAFQDLIAEERDAWKKERQAQIEREKQSRTRFLNTLKERLARGEIDSEEFGRQLAEHF